jgi:hypothetical protein
MTNLAPIIFFGSFILFLIVAVVFMVFPKLSPFGMKGGGCGCKTNKFFIWSAGILGFVALLYFSKTKII